MTRHPSSTPAHQASEHTGDDHADHAQHTEHTAEQARPQPSRAKRVRQWALFTPVLAAVAIAPWFVPWPHSSAAAPSDDPSAMIKQAVIAANGSATTKPQGPSGKNVTNVTKAIDALGVKGYDSPVTGKDIANVSVKPGPYQVLGRLQIPSIHLDVKYGEGVSEASLAHGPGHWPGTPMPGGAGNSVISGHRNTNTQPFKYLNLLHPGDKIIVAFGDDKPVTYSVTGTTIVPQAKYKDFVLRQPSDPKARQLTMFACHPEGNPIYRIVVQASADPVGS